MIPHVSRLLELWRIAAHYRLDTLFPADELPVKAKHALNIIKCIRQHGLVVNAKSFKA